MKEKRKMINSMSTNMHSSQTDNIIKQVKHKPVRITRKARNFIYVAKKNDVHGSIPMMNAKDQRQSFELHLKKSYSLNLLMAICQSSM
ncbi:BgTH12-00195 [Blumeria graminis f. sp. triticale]|uniref:Bgt-51295 n=2 Tax=Blumeria graminis TaxID=34373 RepID=A0A9X9MLB5_BLUGR|nr:BgTH12-00195 [Blumeria graminis f. sp. triticale]VDB92727.1 Bgt-51295 [Blumeria graminis f. sp. tritici]